MKLHNNETVFDNLNPPKRHFPMRSRILAFALIAISCLMIVLGLFIDRFAASNIAYLSCLILIATILLFPFLSRFLLKSIASQRGVPSTWTLKSYKKSIAWLDERESQVIDQAYSMSYRIIELVFSAALAIIVAIYALDPTYHLGPGGILFIMFGIYGLVSYLPTAVFIWNKEV